MSEAGADVIEAMQGSEYAEALAQAMAGLVDMFELLMDDTADAANNSDVALGFMALRDGAQEAFQNVQEFGMGLVENIDSAAVDIAETDLLSAEDYDSPWQSLREINGDQGGGDSSSSGQPPISPAVPH